MANVNETVQGLLKGMEGFVTTKSVVGQAITMEDGTVLLPLVDVTFGDGLATRCSVEGQEEQTEHVEGRESAR